MPSLVLTLPANVKEAPNEILQISCPDGCEAPQCPWPIEDVLTIAKSVPLRKPRKDVAQALQFSTSGLPEATTQLFQMLCLGMAMTQTQTPTAPVNLTMLRPRDQGLQSLLDKANTSSVAGQLALENVKPVPMESCAPMQSPAVPEGNVENPSAPSAPAPKAMLALPAPNMVANEEKVHEQTKAQPAEPVNQDDGVKPQPAQDNGNSERISLKDSIEKIKEARMRTTGSKNVDSKATQRPRKRPAASDKMPSCAGKGPTRAKAAPRKQFLGSDQRHAITIVSRSRRRI